MIARALVLSGIVLGAAAVVSGGVAVISAVTSSPRVGDFRGTRLGMTARDVRDRFEAPLAGKWQTTAESSEMTLTWAENEGDASAGASARFEFHAGMLVAVRARVAAQDALAHGPPLETSKAAVLTRAPAVPPEANLVAVTILARDCPTHAAEVAAVLASHPAH